MISVLDMAFGGRGSVGSGGVRGYAGRNLNAISMLSTRSGCNSYLVGCLVGWGY